MPAALAYIGARVAGAYAGVLAAHAMFGLPLLQVSGHVRQTAGECLGEVIATFGLLLTIRLVARAPRAQVAACVALWIVAAYWFTSSTSFANPAVTLARSLTDTFAGIAPDNVAGFVASQLIGAGLALGVARLLKSA
jgi:glycerol uptake facilitator-like aquaporin